MTNLKTMTNKDHKWLELIREMTDDALKGKINIEFYYQVMSRVLSGVYQDAKTTTKSQNQKIAKS